MGPEIEERNVVLVISGNLEHSSVVAGLRLDRFPLSVFLLTKGVVGLKKNPVSARILRACEVLL